MLILIVDDEPGIRKSLHQLLKNQHQVVQCEDGQAAYQTLEKTSFDLVITDNQLPGLSGLELIRRGKEISPATSFLLMTAFGSVEQAVEAIRLGADDYLMKPFDIAEIEHRVHRIEELQAWKNENTLRIEAARGADRLIGKSPAMNAAREFIKKVATAPSPVLLLGASGTGKEVVAKAIHESGPRSVRPFIAINCASLNEQLMESELFGHEKGAFTGANAAKPGKFELAKGGTLFLDEVGELGAGLQAKLLRVLQEREFFRVGGVRQIKTDARVIAATHRQIKEMVKSGHFREDLYFRLNVLTFELAPLADRPEDVPLLIDALWERLTRDMGKRYELPAETKHALRTYPYPGNVRELQNVLERLAVLAPPSGLISRENLPPEFSAVAPPSPLDQSQTHRLGNAGLTERIEELEQSLIQQAMEQTHHNQVRAAERLKITRGALQYKLKKYGYDPGTRTWGNPSKAAA